VSPRKKAEPKGATPVDSISHSDSRANIPTGELSYMVDPDEQAPVKVLYPRDPSLDPQLVWRGKDEQDAADLAVPAVPVYIQEKVDPRALVENLRRTAERPEDEPELTLFDDFDGLDPLESVEFYEHQGNWANRMILGDSLLAMTSLAEKEDLRGKVQMIYVDPPYGIKFGSNWQVSTRKRDVKDGKVEDASREPEVVKAFRDTWELGISSYLAYLRDRLVVARELLTETGSVFVQIGDENVHLVRSLLDEVFGSENFVSVVTLRKTGGTTGQFLPATCDYLLWYGRNVEQLKYRQLFRLREFETSLAAGYDLVETDDGTRRRMKADEKAGSEAVGGRRYQLTILTSPRVREARTGYFPITFDGTEYLPTAGEWKTNRDGIARLLAARRIDRAGSTLRYVRYLDDFPASPLTNAWMDLGGASAPTYVVQTNTKIIERCMLMTTDPGDLVLDPTCGSGTTAYVAEQWGRRWITTDTSRVALALARTRLMTARFPYYLLADSDAGVAKEASVTGQATIRESHGGDIRKGFVYKRVPHVTLKSIAQNPDIEEGMSREEVDAAIARHAETEVLVDQPYVDNKRVRVAGRFTVESLSPHRMFAESSSDDAAAEDPEAVQFETMILDNLRKAGVQNTFKGERLSFDNLEPHAGEWINAVGSYTDTDGEMRTVAVSIGSEFATVGPDQIRDAAIEAARAVPPFDVLVVIGFAFDPRAWQTSKELNADTAERKVGRQRVLLTRANPDLSMGDELLKKTGAGNLFTVFGEPDIEIRGVGDEVVVEVHGVDVYDPTTGEVRSSTTADIAAWFVDTDYDGRSFFVRHAYFTGGNKPYESLQRVLKADIDEEAWASLYSTVSRPFAKPSTGKLAVKVINHYGDEIVQVYEVG
jgi:adenine-specific DNA-methyltransferase